MHRQMPSTPKQQRKEREHGETWERARRLYLKYPLLPAADIARLLGVSRQTIDEYVTGLKEERGKRREEAFHNLRRKEGL
jgi:DNA-binding transcriptional regulator LsrR (DeoR family)